MVLSSLLPEKKSPIDGIPVIPGGTLWGGHLHLLREEDFQEALHVWSVKYADENGRCTFWMGPTTPSLSVTRSDDVQALLKNAAHRNIFPLMHHHVQQLFGSNNVGVLNGKEWKKQRARIVKALHAPSVWENHREAFELATNQLVDAILTEIDSRNGGSEPLWYIDDISQLMKGLTMDCFGRAAFSADFGACKYIFSIPGDDNNNDDTTFSAHQIGPAFDILTADLMRRVTRDVLYPTSHSYSLPNAANNQYAKAKDRIIAFLTSLIDERRRETTETTRQSPPSDLLAAFLDHFQTTTSDDNNDGNTAENVKDDPQDDGLAKEIAQSILSLLFAGYETSSVGLTYCLYVLSQHPNVLSNCLDEIGRHDGNTTTKLVYLEAVVKETLRLYPPAISTARTCDRDLELPNGDGTTTLVPKGIYLYCPLWIIQRDPKHFRNPLDFSPERWITRDDDSCSWKFKEVDDADHTNGAWVAFSAGARSCPGQRFAMQEMTTILRTLLPRLAFEVVPSDYVLESHRDGFVQSPKGGISMTMRRRDSR